MHTGAPYRPPCDGWPTSRKKHRGCYQHGRADERGIGGLLNSSKVADYHSSPGANIAPYPRPDKGDHWPYTVTGDCPGNGDNTPQSICVAGNKKCGPWVVYGTGGYDQRSDAAGGVSCFGSSLTVDRNCFNTTADRHDYSRCRKLGWKGLRGQRAWHGLHGMLAHDPVWRVDWAVDPYGCIDYSAYPDCGRGQFENAHFNPEAVKYLAVETSGSTAHTNLDYPNPGDSTWADYHLSASVNAASGVVTRNTASWDSSQPNPKVLLTDPDQYVFFGGSGLLSMQAQAALELYSFDGFSYRGFIAEWSMMTMTWWGYVQPGPSIPDGDNFKCSVSGSTWTYYWVSPVTFDWEVIGYFTYDPGTGSLELTSNMHSGSYANLPGTTDSDTLVISSGNTSYTYTLESYYFQCYHYHDETIMTGTLSSENPITSLWTDVKNLMATWDLADDVTMPWRTDGFLSSVPVVGRQEAKANIDQPDRTPIAVSPRIGLVIVPGTTARSVAAWSDSMGLYADGSVVGAPLSWYDPTLRGCGPYFDWGHVSWGLCKGVDSLGSEVVHSYPVAHGAWSGSPPGDGAAYDRVGTDITDGLMPPEATRWTENDYSRAQFPPGWWVIMRGDVLYCQKWAQIKLPWKAYNFGRPCGVDRMEMAENFVWCVEDAALVGGKWRLTIESTTYLSSGDKCKVCGVDSAPDGIYSVTKISATVYELTTLVRGTDIGDVTAATCGCGIIGKVRFFAAPGICGQESVSGAVQAGANVTITTANITYLVTGDLVDFTGVAGLGANLAVTVTDSTHFTVPGTLGTYTGGGTVAVHGAPAAYWIDDDSKGDFVVMEWSQDYRQVGEQTRLRQEYAESAGCRDRPADPGAAIRVNQQNCGMPAEVYNIVIHEDCLAFSVCDPQVVAGSPKDPDDDSIDTFRNGLTYPFDETDFATKMGDSRYGFRWQGAVLFEMMDPLWQLPHKPCQACDDGSGSKCQRTLCDWTMDDGSCPADDCDEDCIGTSYFPHWPYREMRASLPMIGMETAPALPTGYSVKVLDVAELAAASCPTDDVVIPAPYEVSPDSSGEAGGGAAWLPPEQITPWGTYIEMMYCTCGKLQFTETYNAYGVKVNCP